MTREPMFNIPEKAPLWLCGLLIAIHAIMSVAPGGVISLIYGLAILIPVQTPDVPILRQVFSLFGYGFLHAGWTHVLLNTGMMLAFGVITIRGISAFLIDRVDTGSSTTLFLLIFIAGIVAGGLTQWGWWTVFPQSAQLALGSAGGFSSLFATAAWASGGKDRMLKFGVVWIVALLTMDLAAPLIGVSVALAPSFGGYLAGMVLAPRCVKPNSSGFSITG